MTGYVTLLHRLCVTRKGYSKPILALHPSKLQKARDILSKLTETFDKQRELLGVLYDELITVVKSGTLHAEVGKARAAAC